MANKLSDIDWFEWNGVKCTNYGMHVLVQPSFVRPAERVNTTEIPGRSGTLTVLDGNDVYDDVTLSCTCIIDDPYEVDNGTTISRVAQICGWLRGSGTIKFANRQEGFYIGMVANQISFDQIVSGNPHRSFTVQFRCKPFLYLDSGTSTITIPSSSYSITNPGNVPSEPLIRLTGTGEGTLMIGDRTMLVDDFTGISYILLDCEAKIAYKGERANPNDPLVLLGTRVTGEWITIPTGSSFVTYTGNISSVSIVPRWRCI